MATLVAIRHNATIKAFYVHLKSKVKESKVAIVACMRKLVTILNLSHHHPKNGNRKFTIFAIQLLPTIKTVADPTG